jgi:hypothetical protein
MSGPVSSALVWVVTGLTALGLTLTSPLAAGMLSNVVQIAWLVLSNAR